MKNNRAAGRFVQQVNAAFGSRMSAEAQKLYYDTLAKWDLTEEEWCHALGLITGNEDLDRAPSLARICDYLDRTKRDLRQPAGEYARVVFTRDGKSYCSRSRHIDDCRTLADRIRLMPGASNIQIVMNDPVYPDEIPACDRDKYPEYGADGKLTEAGKQEIEEAELAGIRSHVDSLSAYEARMIVLTDGKQGSMRLSELEPCKIAANAWEQDASESEIADTREQARVIIRAKIKPFVDILVQSPKQERKPGFAQAGAEPADYDDSDIALGKQRIASLDRLEEWERKRESDLSDV